MLPRFPLNVFTLNDEFVLFFYTADLSLSHSIVVVGLEAETEAEEENTTWDGKC